MTTKKFSEIPVGTRFILGGTEYIRIQEERISCCTFYNAAQVSNTSAKIGITPITDVEVNE